MIIKNQGKQILHCAWYPHTLQNISTTRVMAIFQRKSCVTFSTMISSNIGVFLSCVVLKIQWQFTTRFSRHIWQNLLNYNKYVILFAPLSPSHTRRAADNGFWMPSRIGHVKVPRCSVNDASLAHLYVVFTKACSTTKTTIKQHTIIILQNPYLSLDDFSLGHRLAVDNEFCLTEGNRVRVRVVADPVSGCLRSLGEFSNFRVDNVLSKHKEARLEAYKKKKPRAI